MCVCVRACMSMIFCIFFKISFLSLSCRVRRYRRQLIPLTDRDGSDESDDEEEEEMDFREPAFMVSHVTCHVRVMCQSHCDFSWKFFSVIVICAV